MMMSRGGGDLLHHHHHHAASLLIAISLLIAAAMFPSCSAADPTSTAPRRRKPVDMGVLQHFSSSVVFPLRGNVYPNGLYYAMMNIGQPRKPYFLDIDTGSDLSWLHCNAPCTHCPPKCPHPLYQPPSNRMVPCKHPICSNLPGDRDCSNNPQQCDYEIDYTDGFSSLGVLIVDTFTLPINNSLAYPFLAFGCGYDQQGPGMDKPSPVDGMIGLGSGPTSFVSQLKAQGITRSVIGHCLGRRGTGYLFFGDGLIPSYGVTWAPMKHNANRRHKYYSPGLASLSIGRKPVHAGSLQVVFDSGSSYTYFANRPYQALVAALRALLSKSPLKETKDAALPLCWEGPKPFKSVLDVNSYFTPLVLNFANRKGIQLEIPAENYLIVTNLGNACLGILNGNQIGLQDLSVIGDISMLDVMVIYDNEKQQIGWARVNCDRPPNEDANNGFEERFCQPQFTSMGFLTDVCPDDSSIYREGRSK